MTPDGNEVLRQAIDGIPAGRPIVLLSHVDPDGVAAAATVLRYLRARGHRGIRAYFSPAGQERLEGAVGAIPPPLIQRRGRPRPVLVALDLAGDYEPFAPRFNRIIVVDHHVDEVRVVSKSVAGCAIAEYSRPSPSAAQIVHEAIGGDTRLVGMVNEIDQGRTPDAATRALSDYFFALSFHAPTHAEHGDALVGALRKMAAPTFDLDAFLASVAGVVEAYRRERDAIVSGLTPDLVTTASGSGCAVFYTDRNIYANNVVDALKEGGSVFDVVILVKYLPASVLAPLGGKDVATKLELRSMTGVDVRRIAELFGGGGHMYASGAFVARKLDKEAILRTLRERA